MEKIYFGHPINLYDTDSETFLISKLEQFFTGYHIENPNQIHHDESYKKFKVEKGNGMLYFFEEVLPSMDAGVFLAFEDGMFGAGVYKEAKFLVDEGKNIYEIDLEGELSALILDESRQLSIEETKKRIYPTKSF